MGICGRSLCLAARALSLALLLVLLACGGGGGESTAPAAPLAPPPVFKQDVVPSGTRIDLRARNFFPYAPGDFWSYTSSSNADPDGLKRSEFVSYEPETAFSAFPAAAQSIIFPFEEYPQPFYAVGQLRTVYRSGGWGEDLDGDGFQEGFKFTYAQIYRGTESFAVSGGTVTTARFSNTVTFELISSDASIPAVKVISAEEVQFAANFGMVKRVDKTMDGASRVIDPGSTWVIYDATVSGRTLAESVVSGSSKLVQLEHIGLVADRTRARYIAALPASGAFPGGLATIDASTGAVLQTLAVAEQPEVLAVSPDGRFLYAGLNGTGELAKYDLSTMALVARTPISGRAVSIAISPVDLDSVAVARTDLCSGCTGPTSGVVLLKSMVLQPNVSYDRFYSTTIIGFDPSGSVLYSVDSGSTAGTFVRHLVLADGLQPDSILPSTTFLFPGAIWFDGSQMGIGMHVFGLPGPTYRFDLRPNFYTQCVPLQAGVSTGVAVCLEGAGPYPPVGVAQLEVALVDMSTGALLAKPSYATLSALRSASMVTGIVGQIAFSEKSDGFLRTYSQIRIYSNPILR